MSSWEIWPDKLFWELLGTLCRCCCCCCDRLLTMARSSCRTYSELGTPTAALPGAPGQENVPKRQRHSNKQRALFFFSTLVETYTNFSHWTQNEVSRRHLQKCQLRQGHAMVCDLIVYLELNSQVRTAIGAYFLFFFTKSFTGVRDNCKGSYLHFWRRSTLKSKVLGPMIESDICVQKSHHFDYWSLYFG